MNLDGRYDPTNRWRAVVDHGNGVLVVHAGPGTGKTRSLIRRIESLCRDRGVPPEQVCYLTFIREIANAFRADVHRELMAQPWIDNLRISTLHSFAFRLLRNCGHLVGLTGPLHPVNLGQNDADDAAIAVEDIRSALTWHLKRRPKLRALRSALEDMKEVWRAGKDPAKAENLDHAVLEQYRRLSRAYRLLDWDEVVPLGISVLERLVEPPDWLKQIHHLLVDEYQDFNPAEQAFMGKLQVASWVVAGDHCQSIYSGRGAAPDGILTLAASPGVDTVTLVECWRCPATLVAAINRFLTTMSPPRHGLLVPIKDGGQIAIVGFKSAKAELDFLHSRLSQLLAQLPDTPTDKDGIACLFPSHRVLLQYHSQLTGRGLRVRAKTTAYRFPSEPRLRLLLRLIANPDQPFLQRCALEAFPEITSHHKHQVVQKVVAEGCLPVDAVRECVDQGEWMGAAKDAGEKFMQLMSDCQNRASTALAGFLKTVLPPEAPCPPDAIIDFITHLEQGDMEDLIESTISCLAGLSAEEASGEYYIEMLTMHGSKGLTRAHIFLPGLEQSWLPASASGGALEERRRLFLVAITRATASVTITWPKTRARGDSLNYSSPGRGECSKFARELGVTIEE